MTEFNIDHLFNKDWIKGDNRISFNTFLVNPNDRAALPSHSVWPGHPTNNLFGMHIYESQHVPQGQVFIVEKPDFKPYTYDYERIRTPERDDFHARFNHFFQDRIASAFGIPLSYFEKPYKWQRGYRETVFAWGERLSAKGLLDDPAIRWEYQKAVWKSIGLTLKRMVQR